MSKFLIKQSENYSLWYNELVKRADLAEHAPVKGCMIIKPYGFAIWENMQAILDKMFKETGHQNAYFPIFIPKSYLNKEAKHVKGFAKECAVVTHHRLKNAADNSGIIVDPDAQLEEELIIRPTSETIIWNSYKNWINSYRDLPILLNQWANVVRWEMRTRFFLRTAEFLWQEGHTAHATKKEAIEEAEKIMNIYADFVENYMAIPIIKGTKTANERFAGAEETYTIEALMQDGKALQVGTSHFLDQNFAKAFDVQFSDKNGKSQYVWGTSWGVSTRLMGALIMAHGDDKGLILPPKLAPIQVVIVPIFKTEEELESVSEKAKQIQIILEKRGYNVKYDHRDTYKPGFKFADWEMKGVPLRLVIGPKDLANDTVEINRRDTGEKQIYNINNIDDIISSLLGKIQSNMYQNALAFRKKMTFSVDSFEEFKDVLKKRGGFILAHWDGDEKTEEKIKLETKATIRCIPLNAPSESGKCIYSNKPSQRRVLFAKAY